MLLSTEFLIEDRLISGSGLLRIPAELEQVYYYSILVDVVRPPTKIFRSFKYNPPRQRYATLTFLKDGYVLREESLDYPRRRFDLILDPIGQVLLAVKCAYEGLLISFASQNQALGLQIVSYTDLVKPMESLNLIADEIRFVCEYDTALQVRLFYRELISCSSESVKQPKPPPPPPPLPPLQPGEPIGEISPPYDENDDVTDPSEIDTVAPPDPNPFDYPAGDDCEIYRVEVSMTDTVNGEVNRVDFFYAPVVVYFRSSAESGDGKETLLIDCRNFANPPDNPPGCQSPITFILLQTDDDLYVSHRVIDVSPY